MNSDLLFGLYIFEMLVDGQLYFKWNGIEIYYNSGLWGGFYFMNLLQLGRIMLLDVFYFDNSIGSLRFYYNIFGRLVIVDIFFKWMCFDLDGVVCQYIWVIDFNFWQIFISVFVELCDLYYVCGKNFFCISSNYILGCICLLDF